jgi:hypothetical protein
MNTPLERAILPSGAAVDVATIVGAVGIVLAIAQRIWWRRKYGKFDG